jgi:putative membrane protein
MTLVVWIFALLAATLHIADRPGFGGVRGKSIVGALGQSLPPLVALVAALL